jgi:hypothetical protein
MCRPAEPAVTHSRGLGSPGPSQVAGRASAARQGPSQAGWAPRHARLHAPSGGESLARSMMIDLEASRSIDLILRGKETETPVAVQDGSIDRSYRVLHARQCL